MPKLIVVPNKKCEFCSSMFNRSIRPNGVRESMGEWEKRKFCSHECYAKYNVGEKHWFWNGGIKNRKDGYLRYGDDRYVHRVTLEKHLKRELNPDEFVHHINGDTSDNKLENLCIMTNSEHRKFHNKDAQRDEKGRWCRRE